MLLKKTILKWMYRYVDGFNIPWSGSLISTVLPNVKFTDFWDFTVCGANRFAKFSDWAQTFSRHDRIGTRSNFTKPNQVCAVNNESFHECLPRLSCKTSIIFSFSALMKWRVYVSWIFWLLRRYFETHTVGTPCFCRRRSQYYVLQ